MDFMELVWARRSVRSYLDKEIPEDQLKKIMEAAQSTPSAGNKQPWHFYIVKNKVVINKIVDDSCRQDFIRNAPVVIVVCADIKLTLPKYGDRGRHLYCLQDTAAAIQNILLYAESEGLGACWCGAFDEDALSKILNLQEDMRPIAIIPMGYPAAVPPMPKRRQLEEIFTIIT